MFHGLLLAAMLGAVDACSPASAQQPTRPNFLLITADDMNYNSPGLAGCRIPDITPNIDRLAAEGLYFTRAHVAAAICQPCRQALMTGRYPHSNSAGGFDPIRPEVPTLQEQLHRAGYFQGIMAKVPHLAPQARFCWDVVVDASQLGVGRDPKKYYQHAQAFFAAAKASGKPFFLMANSQDPHRPFAGSDDEKTRPARKAAAKGKAGKRAPRPARGAQGTTDDEGGSSGYPAASKYYTPEEIEVPGFLPDLPNVRKELAQYFTSVHRCDETVGQVLRALDEASLRDTTLVMFLSDNGMSFPYAKTNCYLASTRTPWIVRWPGKVKPGTRDSQHFICGVDFMPTILEAAGLAPVPGVQGKSFLALLAGRRQAGRDMVFTEINTISSGASYPMRCAQNGRFGYIFNAWSDGQRVFRNETQAGLTFKAMQAAAAGDPQVAARVRFFQYRVPEEFYDFQKDPDALHNLIDDPQYKDEIARMRRSMLQHLIETQDPQTKAFEELVNRGN
jgi:N-sulfoglucosamine sulfohydrolase